MTRDSASAPLFVRAAPRSGKPLDFTFDGVAMTGFEGETVLAALLCAGARVRRFEFAESDRAGFCLMGACQDCWVSREDGSAVRACTTPLQAGMRLRSAAALPGSEADA